MRIEQVHLVGRGYVGLPLSVEFAAEIERIRFEFDDKNVAGIRQYIDP